MEFSLGIIREDMYTDFDQFPKLTKEMAQYKGTNRIEFLDVYPTTLFECSRYLSVHGVPADTEDRMVSMLLLHAVTLLLLLSSLVGLTNLNEIS